MNMLRKLFVLPVTTPAGFTRCLRKQARLVELACVSIVALLEVTFSYTVQQISFDGSDTQLNLPVTYAISLLRHAQADPEQSATDLRQEARCAATKEKSGKYLRP